MDIIEKYKLEYKAVMHGPVSEETVDELLVKYSVGSSVYRNWLIETGGGPIGPNWYDGIEELEESQKKFKSERWNISGFVIGWDGAGNPIVLKDSGVIITKDHNFGGIHEIAKSFEAILVHHVSS